MPTYIILYYSCTHVGLIEKKNTSKHKHKLTEVNFYQLSNKFVSFFLLRKYFCVHIYLYILFFLFFNATLS